MQVALLVLCILTFAVADYFAARFGQLRDRSSLAVVVLVGPCAYLLFGYLATQSSLVKMGGYANGGIVLATALAGVFLLGEKPDRTTWLGLAALIVGLTLLAHGKVERGEA